MRKTKKEDLGVRQCGHKKGRYCVVRLYEPMGSSLQKAAIRLSQNAGYKLNIANLSL